ncbi:hypothetical protein LTR78_010911 [Recurvomyces mirabilis]|uniref:Uncharacterized protein n=1 Tax=Recurvomyces mirabilis TaxID=574656 RepID=A0AAE0TMI4_9PEZI|nr:hypothetical protein LTR78_010911 [Recurvomyces mirabilis]
MAEPAAQPPKNFRSSRFVNLWLESCNGPSHKKWSPVANSGLSDARSLFIVGLAKRMVESVGQALGDLVGVSASGQPTWIKQEVANAHFELKVIPLLRLDVDSDVDAAGDYRLRDSGVDAQPATLDDVGYRYREQGAGRDDEVLEEEVVADEVEAESESSSDDEVDIVEGRSAIRDPGNDASDQSVGYEMLDKTPPWGEAYDHEHGEDGSSSADTPPKSWKIHRYPSVSGCDYILTPDTLSRRAHSVLVNAPFADIKAAITNAVGPSVGPKITRVGHSDWTVRLSNASEFISIVNRVVQICAVQIPLVPYTPKTTQAFICKSIPPNVSLAGLTSVLLAGLRPHRIHVMQAPSTATNKARGSHHIVVLLDSPVDFEWFGYAAPCGTGEHTWSVRFNAQVGNCTSCKLHKHSLGSCPELRAVTGDHEDHPHWLAHKPQLDT